MFSDSVCWGVFFISFVIIFSMFSVRILPSGSWETAFFKMVLELLIAKIWTCSQHNQLFPFSTNNFLYRYLFFFGLPMEIYKPAVFLQTMFSQTPRLPSSLFQDLIENFPHVGWKKNSECLICSHPWPRSCAPLTALLPKLLLCSLYSLDLTPSLLLLSEVLFLRFSLNSQPRKQEEKEKCGCVFQNTLWISHLIPL